MKKGFEQKKGSIHTEPKETKNAKSDLLAKGGKPAKDSPMLKACKGPLDSATTMTFTDGEDPKQRPLDTKPPKRGSNGEMV